MTELLSPAGDWTSLRAALDAGADAIYFGVKGINMRAAAGNFMIEELAKVAKTAHDSGAKAYLALNTIVYEDELSMIKEILAEAKKAGIDAIICWDMAVIKEAKDLGLLIHISTQASVSNSQAAEQYKGLGASRIILARECSIEQIRKISISTDSELEVFIHGAMCIAVSGRCFMSQFIYGRSANRGECLQPCRREYIIKDPEDGHELELNNHFVMSPKDLCTMQFIDELLDLGIASFKIEGRNRKPEYVSTVTSSYREAIDLYKEGNLTEEKKQELIDRMRTVYNRGFSSGFYKDKPGPDDITDNYGSKSTEVKEFVGLVTNYFQKVGVAEIKLQTGSLKVGDEILIQGPTTGSIRQTVGSMQIEHADIDEASKGQDVAIGSKIARKNDKVYVIKERA